MLLESQESFTENVELPLFLQEKLCEVNDMEINL